MPDTVDELRYAAAKATRLLLEDARHEPDVRRVLAAVLNRLGHANIVDWADADPQAVIDFQEGLGDVDTPAGYRGMQ